MKRVRLPCSLPALLLSLEEEHIRAALHATAGCRKEAARLLGVKRTTLVEKVRRMEERRAGRLLDVAAPGEWTELLRRAS